ncbi:hypothetical protein LSTR_LSTR007193 [Laodelphax striatellus]|uniref:Fibronectin type III domain-containing protein n=1 Tax=Laodelphax striatellus TaxID=195883 RepID=A0A482WR79_LAOST|nr:hypothetical protein LSTR_LSTR007193 [Laodelphax striatellus]
MNATNTTHRYTGDDVIQPSNQVQDETPHIVYYEEPTLTIPPFPTDPNALHPGSVVIRTEEALIVIMVLVLWVAAIALFFNRWGKIRMLEPYQPKFHQEHRPSCPAADTIGGQQHRASVSKFGMMDPPIFASVGGAYRTLAASRPRQNSVFVGGSFNQLPSNPPRKTKSAMDIQSLVLNEQSSATGSIISNSGAGLGMKQSLSPQDRRTSVSGFLRRPSCSTGLLLSPSITGRRNSAISDFLPLKDRLQTPHYHTDFLSPLPSCSHLSPGYSGLSCPDGRSGPSSRRMSMCASDHYSSRERRPSFNNVLAQVTAERRPSSSMLRISNV